MLREIVLGDAERNLVIRLLNESVTADPASARIFRSLRKDLQLKELEKRFREEGEALKEDPNTEVSTWDSLLESEPATYTTDETGLHKLQELLNKPLEVKSPNGQPQPLVLGMVEAYANLCDAVGEALAR